MDYKTKFERYETKYLITQHQKMILLSAMQPYMRLDQYGHTTIRNIYYDTKNYRLIRHSLEKPIYKEKLRIRSYNQATATSPVFSIPLWMVQALSKEHIYKTSFSKYGVAYQNIILPHSDKACCLIQPYEQFSI